jgi:dihydrofolate synthase/folylpolyglutamate synthase
VNVGEASLARRSKAKEAGPRPPLTYKEALAWLYNLQRFGIKLGLENIRRLLDELCSGVCVKSPALGTSASTFKVIHVAGTNGKGSVCAMIDSICRAQGHRTGLFTSPHLVTFRERVRVSGEMISEDAVANGLTAIRDLVVGWEPHPTFFEVTTALALEYFSEAKIDVAILETGIGGRLDATNAIQSDVSVITSIDFDHEQWLGNTLPEIASEKAGIMKARVPVVCAPQQPEAEKVIRARAAECEAPLEFVAGLYQETPIALAGSYQKQNAALAVAALRAAKIDITHSAIAHGLANIEWPARFQRWDERTIIDGAHNPGAARILAETWREMFGDQKVTLVLAVLSDKDLRGICEELEPIADSVLLPKIRSERAADPKILANVLANVPFVCRAGASPAGNPESVRGCPTISITQSVGEALDRARAKPNPILITGSLHFAGEVLAHLRGEPAAFEECAQ